MSETLQQLSDYIAGKAGSLGASCIIAHGELSVHTTPVHLLNLIAFLRDDEHCLFQQCVDVTAVDHPERDQRFEVVYHLLSLRKNLRLRVKLDADEKTPVPSIIDLHPAAGWFEREVWDMYGVQFVGNPALRRILTDYEFEGHPLRKDFPLSGFVELRYDEAQKKVVYSPVKLTQAFRAFDFESPWEGATYPAPAEKTGAA